MAPLGRLTCLALNFVSFFRLCHIWIGPTDRTLKIIAAIVPAHMSAATDNGPLSTHVPSVQRVHTLLVFFPKFPGNLGMEVVYIHGRGGDVDRVS